MPAPRPSTHAALTIFVCLIALAELPAQTTKPVADDAIEAKARKSDAESLAAATVFWLRIRDVASRIEAAATMRRAPVGHPVVASAVQDEFEAQVLKTDSITEELRNRSLELVRVPLGLPRVAIARLERFTVNVSSSFIRAFAPHPDSPAIQIENAALRPSTELEAEVRPTGPFGFQFIGDVTLESLETAKRKGASFALVSRPLASLDIAQSCQPREIVGHLPSTPLPIPVVFTCAANERHLADNMSAEGGGIGMSIVVEENEAEPCMVVLRLRGVDSTRKVIVTSSRSRRSLLPSAASQSLEVAALVEAARIVAVTALRNPSGRMYCDVEFVHVADARFGHDFVRKSATPNQTILGVYSLEELTDASASSAVFAVLESSGSRSLLGDALCGTLEGFRNHPGAWRQVAFDASAPSLGAETLDAVSQARLPIVSIATGIFDAPRLAVSNDAYPAPKNGLNLLPAAHAYSGSLLDVLTQITDKQVGDAVSATRALVISLLRVGATFAP